MKKLRIAILGANGQVGSELALLLADAADIDLVGVVRSEYSAALLRLAGVPHETASFEDGRTLARALDGCDLVVDLTYPSGQLADIPSMLERNMRAVMRAMRRGARYLHMSSIMAFGMPSGSAELRSYRIPRASYGHIKRWAEGRAVRLGRELGVRTYVYRLGQAHGVLQAVTQEYRRRAECHEFRLAGRREELATTVFLNAVADAVLVCARDQVAPERIYTLVSNPQWTLAELGDAYRALYAPDLEVGFESRTPSSLRVIAASRRLALGPAARDLLDTQVFLRAPELFIRVKGRYRKHAVRHDAAMTHQLPALQCLVGRVPGELVPAIDSSVGAATRVHRAVAARLESLLEAARR